jgi:hypothetical protein
VSGHWLPSFESQAPGQSSDALLSGHTGALQRQVNEQYLPAFNEVTASLQEHHFRGAELADVGVANETNRFLNWVRLTYAPGDVAWQTPPLRSQAERATEILRLGAEWSTTDKNQIPKDYVDWRHQVQPCSAASGD